MSESLKLAACATHPIQYQAPLWRRLASMPGIEFEAFFGTDMSVRGYTDKEFGTKVAWDTPLTAGYVHHFLSTDPRIEEVTAKLPTAHGLRSHFARFRPDVVLLTAYAGRFHLGAWRAARSVGAKVIIRHEASDVAVSRSRLKGALRDFLLRRFYTRLDGFAVIGTEARRHLLRLGVPERKMVPAPYCVDSDFFAGEVVRWGPRREELRRELGISPDDLAVVFSGKLVAKKDPLLIPAALQRLDSSLRKRVHLLVAGDGELRGELERECRGAIGPRAHFLGFLNQSEIGRAYAAADLLVLPSRRGAGETWGLVVNEAMQFGLGVVVSDGVGCAADLVGAEDSDFVFPSGDAEQLAGALRRSMELGSAKRALNSVRARTRVADFSCLRAAEGVRQLATRVSGRDEVENPEPA